MAFLRCWKTGWSLRSRQSLRHDSAICHPLRQELGGSRVAAEYFEVPFYCTYIWQGKRPASNHKWRRHGNFYGTPKLRWGARETIELRSRITEIFVARCHWKWQPRRICLGLVSKFSFWKSISPFALYDVYLGYPGPFESLNMRMFSKHCPKGKRLSRKYLAGNYITYRPFKGTLEDDFPLSQVIYVSSLKGNILRNHVWYF